MNQFNYTITAFGKIISMPTSEGIISLLPEMSILLFKDEDRGENFPWRTACIYLELDASGNSMDEARESPKGSIKMYIGMEKKASGGFIIEKAKNIVKAAFKPSRQKAQFMELYRKAQLDYTMDTIISIINELKAA